MSQVLSRAEPYVPRHRAASPPKVRTRRPLRTALVLTGLAATATAVTVGLASTAPAGSQAGRPGSTVLSASDAPRLSAADLAEREDDEASRSDSRATTDRAKARELSVDGARATTVTDDASDDDPRDVARALLPTFGWGQDQYGCLDSLWTRESGWRVNADNPTSSAYGIPQALPGSKMSSAGSDWATNPVTQITWGLGYIRDRYGSPCGAWGHSESHGYY